MKSDIEHGLIVGYKIALLESEGRITFTKDWDFDDEMFRYAQILIKEWNCNGKIDEHYFSEFVQNKLLFDENDKKRR